MKNTVITLFIVLSLFGVILAVFVIAKIKNSEPYFVSKEFIVNNESIKQQLGSVEGFGWLVVGSIDEINTNGSADLSFEIKGERKSSQIRLILAKDSSGSWSVLTYNLEK